MPDFHSNDDLGKLKATMLSEDEGLQYESQTLGSIGAMAMSYMLTVVHFCSTGEPRLDMIDSRFGKERLACITKELESDQREVNCRLVITEDLPRDTYDLLHHTIGVDTRLLDDHRSNGHGAGFASQADLDVDKAPRSSSRSIAMPFDLQIGPEIFPMTSGWRDNEYVEEDVTAILKHHQLVNYLRYDWQPLFIGSPLPALFFSTYRRLSFQSLSGPIPTVALLLYPPLWDLRSYQGSKYIFHVSADLRYFSNPQPCTHDGSRAATRQRSLLADQACCSMRIQQLFRHLVNDLDPHSLSRDELTRYILDWVTMNTYKSFEASVESSVRCWYNVKSYIKATSSGHVGNKHLCERFRQLTLIKCHQMDKARTELGIHINTSSDFGMTHIEDTTHQDYISQQWQRSHTSLQWVLDDAEDALRNNERDLQIQLTTLQIEESRKAIRQGAVVKRLTALAFIFIPISTVCSAFGMNIQEFDAGLPSVWIFAVVALAAAVVTAMCSLELSGNIFWAMLSLLNTWAASWRNWWQNVYHNASTNEASLGLGAASIGANLAGIKGVKPWVDPKRKGTMRTRNLRRLPVQCAALLALAPFWITGTIILRVRRFEQRGRAFKAGRIS
ncbi:MAG: hypothetical protein Q9224_004601 [Gallowayella concinna]